MKTYLDSSGKIIEERNLEDVLKEKSPELGKRLDHIKENLDVAKAYGTYLYSIPIESERNVPEEMRRVWERFIEVSNTQAGLEETNISLVETLRGLDVNLVNDKVLVVSSDRPFVDSVFSEKKRGSASAWVGVVKQHNITNVENSNFVSIDGLIYRRVVLENARKLTDETLVDLARINYGKIYGIIPGEHYAKMMEKFKKEKLGTEEITVYAPWHQTDIFLLNHVPSDLELKADEFFPNVVSEYVKLDPLYKFEKHEFSGATVIHTCEPKSRDNREYSVILEGKTSLSPKEIYEDVSSKVKEFVKLPKSSKFQLFVAKKIPSFFTAEESVEASKSYNPIKIFRMFWEERVKSLTDDTLVMLYFDRSNESLSVNGVVSDMKDYFLNQGFAEVFLSEAHSVPSPGHSDFGHENAFAVDGLSTYMGECFSTQIPYLVRQEKKRFKERLAWLKKI